MTPPKWQARRTGLGPAATWLSAVLLALAGCGQAVDDPATRLRQLPARAAVPQADPQAAEPSPSATTDPEAARAALAPPADWAVTALLPQGDIDLPDGRVERSYRVALANGPLERPAGLLRLLAAPPGVEVVRGTLALDEMPALTRLTPAGAVLLRHPPTLVPDPTALQWALQDAPPAAASVQGRLLAGPAMQPAVAAITSHQATPEPQPGTLLLAQLRSDATVGAVNQALRQAGVRIVQMRTGNHGLTLRTQASGPGAAGRAQQQLNGASVFSGVWLQPAPPPVAMAPGAVAAAAPTDCAD